MDHISYLVNSGALTQSKESWGELLSLFELTNDRESIVTPSLVDLFVKILSYPDLAKAAIDQFFLSLVFIATVCKSPSLVETCAVTRVRKVSEIVDQNLPENEHLIPSCLRFLARVSPYPRLRAFLPWSALFAPDHKVIQDVKETNKSDVSVVGFILNHVLLDPLATPTLERYWAWYDYLRLVAYYLEQQGEDIALVHTCQFLSIFKRKDLFHPFGHEEQRFFYSAVTGARSKFISRRDIFIQGSKIQDVIGMLYCKSLDFQRSELVAYDPSLCEMAV